MSPYNDKDVERLRKQEAWRAAVHETMRAWDLPHAEAEEVVAELHWGIQDQVALQHAKAALPTAQAQIQDAAVQLADALALGLLAPATVERFRTAIAEYDAEATRQYKERSTGQ